MYIALKVCYNSTINQIKDLKYDTKRKRKTSYTRREA